MEQFGDYLQHSKRIARIFIASLFAIGSSSIASIVAGQTTYKIGMYTNWNVDKSVLTSGFPGFDKESILEELYEVETEIGALSRVRSEKTTSAFRLKHIHFSEHEKLKGIKRVKAIPRSVNSKLKNSHEFREFIIKEGFDFLVIMEVWSGGASDWVTRWLFIDVRDGKFETNRKRKKTLVWIRKSGENFFVYLTSIARKMVQHFQAAFPKLEYGRRVVVTSCFVPTKSLKGLEPIQRTKFEDLMNQLNFRITEAINEQEYMKDYKVTTTRIVVIDHCSKVFEKTNLLIREKDNADFILHGHLWFKDTENEIAIRLLLYHPDDSPTNHFTSTNSTEVEGLSKHLAKEINENWPFED